MLQTLTRFAAVAAVAIITLLFALNWTLRVSNSDERVFADSAPDQAESQPTPKQAAVDFVVRATGQPAPLSDLRQSYLHLLQQKVRQMSDEGVKAEAEVLRRELAHRHVEAQRSIGEVIEALEKIAVTFRGTSAAKRAGRALDTLRADSRADGDFFPPIEAEVFQQ